MAARSLVRVATAFNLMVSGMQAAVAAVRMRDNQQAQAVMAAAVRVAHQQARMLLQALQIQAAVAAAVSAQAQ